MSVEESLLEAIRESPEDDAPRLIYADWLSERPDEAEAARGEFVRAHVALARAEEWSDEWHALRDATRATLDRFGRAWLAPFAALGVESIERYDRGLPTRFALSADAYRRNRDALARLAPTLDGLSLRGRGSELRRLLDAPPVARLTRLDFGRGDLEDDDVFAIAASPWLDEPTDFSLAGHFLDDASVGRVLQAFSRRPVALDSLDLSFNRLTPDAGDALATLPVFERVRTLDLSGLSLAGGLPRLLSACSPDSLRTLRLACAHLNHTGPEPIPAALLPTLEEIDLSQNPDQAVYRLLFYRMPWLTGLKRLDLSHCGLAAPPDWVPPDELRLPALESLEMTGNHLGDPGAALIARAGFFPRLRRLSLVHNGIGDRGASAFARAERLPLLRELDLSRNRVGPSGRFALQSSPAMARVRLNLEFNSAPLMLM